MTSADNPTTIIALVVDNRTGNLPITVQVSLDLSLALCLSNLIFAMTSHLPHLISYALIDSIRLSNNDVGDNAGGGLKEFLRLSGSNPEMWSDIFTLNRVDLIKALAGMQVSLNNLLELISETKQIPDIFSHLEFLKNELDEIKSFKEDKF